MERRRDEHDLLIEVAWRSAAYSRPEIKLPDLKTILTPKPVVPQSVHQHRAVAEHIAKSFGLKLKKRDPNDPARIIYPQRPQPHGS